MTGKNRNTRKKTCPIAQNKSPCTGMGSNSGLCGENAELLNVQAGGTYSNHFPFSGRTHGVILIFNHILIYSPPYWPISAVTCNRLLFVPPAY